MDEKPGSEHGPMPEPRLIDRLLEWYVKIGGYMGVSLAAAAFLLVCLFSYKMFFVMKVGHLGNLPIDLLLIGATLIAAATAAVTVFFCASVFWLPMLFGLLFFGSLLVDVLQHMHHYHH